MVQGTPLSLSQGFLSWKMFFQGRGSWVGRPWRGCWPLGCHWGGDGPWGPEDRGQRGHGGSVYSVAGDMLPWSELLWRDHWFSVSGPACPAGMEYKECVSPCTRTCQSLHINEVCQEQCVDGCSCPGNELPTLFTDLRPCQCPWLGEAR